MRVISKHPKLSTFWEIYPDAKATLLAWHRTVEHADWKGFSDVRRHYAHADQVGRYVIFNIGGNKFRLAVLMSYPKGKVYVHRVLTHEEYDRGDWKED